MKSCQQKGTPTITAQQRMKIHWKNNTNSIKAPSPPTPTHTPFYWVQGWEASDRGLWLLHQWNKIDFG